MKIEDVLNILYKRWAEETIAIMLRVMDTSNQSGLRWRGQLRNSLKYVLTEEGVDILMTAAYGQFQDEGVNGLRNNYKSPFSFSAARTGVIDKKVVGKMARALRAWAKSKGLNEFAVAYSLQRKGIKPKRFFKTVYEARIDILVREIEKAYAETIELQIKETLTK